MDWNGDQTKLDQLCQLLALASTPDNSVQQQVAVTLGQFREWPDFTMYLVAVFGGRAAGQPEFVRQSAGLLLKTVVHQTPSVHIPAAVTEYIQATMLTAIRDASQAIRHTAGTVITTLVNKVGITACRPLLDKLTELLGDQSQEVVEGCFNALGKICEDNVSWFRDILAVCPEEVEPFAQWSAQRLLPRVLEFASLDKPLSARRNAIECLNEFALGWVLGDPSIPELYPFSQGYVMALGKLAQDTDVAILKCVCKGFVCVVEGGWEITSDPTMCEAVLQFMLKASQHPEYAVRLEALAIWPRCTNHHDLWKLLDPIIPQLVPVLLDNMVYSPADYMGMEASQLSDDNAAVPDKPEDIKPRTHREQGDDSDDEGGGQGGGGTWGAEWTARKAAASSLDNMANAFRGHILPHVLPLVQQKLEDTRWEVQESGVLALGAIAIGCLDELAPFLPRVMGLLLQHCDGPKPLLRSISCWCATRFAPWICNPRNPEHHDVLRAVLKALLERVLDKNKPVQEAACSALATLHEEAKSQLLPFLPDILRTLVRAFEFYQAKNLLILYDAVGTLSEAVGSELNKPQYVEALLVPLSHKFEAVADNDRSIVPLFECLSLLMQSLNTSMMPMVMRIVERCVRLVLGGARASVLFRQNPRQNEKPDREIMAASIDLLSGVVSGLRENVKEVLARNNFLCVVPEVLADTGTNTKQSAFALVGDSATHCIEYIVPLMPQIMPLCAQALRENTLPAVTNNASWAIGEVCVKVPPEAMAPFVDGIVQGLVSVLAAGNQLPPQQRSMPLLTNVCITLGRLGGKCGGQMGAAFQGFAPAWLGIMRQVPYDGEKVTAFEGLCTMIKANPQACANFMPQLVLALCSFAVPPKTLQPAFQEILTSYREMMGTGWGQLFQVMPPDIKQRLSAHYGISS